MLINSVFQKDSLYTHSFDIDGLKFSTWNPGEFGQKKTEYWLIKSSVEGNDINDARKRFNDKLNKILPRISFLSQSYASFLLEPYMISKVGSEVVFFYYTKKSRPVGLHFDQHLLGHVKSLCDDNTINESFYYYWNDMINTGSYPGRLVLLFSALESLIQSRINPYTSSNDKKNFYTDILGEDLGNKVRKQNTGIRHRMVHGEYFNPEIDTGNNYFQEIYDKVIEYFNTEVFKKNLIEKVSNPGRHPDNNRIYTKFFIRRTDFKTLVINCDNNTDYLDNLHLEDQPTDY